MNLENIPQFTPQAAVLWAELTPEIKNLLLSNVWCSKCRHEVKIKNYTGAVRGVDLLLVGQCSECLSDVARVIESE
jgi:hypothetical protein